MTDGADALAELRRQVVALLATIDLGEMPRPDRIRRPGDKRGEQPGPDWRPAHGIRIFIVDTPEDAGFVYMAQEQHGYSLPGDWESFKPDDARRVGMALLAAAEWADQHHAGIPRIGAARAARRKVAAT